MKRILPFFLLVMFASCGKSDTTPPEINLISPANNQQFANGDNVLIKADITDNEGIHQVHLIVTDNSGGHVIHFEEHYDGKTYSLNQSFTAQAGKTYKIEMDAVDHNDNVGKKELNVSAN